MTTQQKKSILLALRNAAKILEEELEVAAPVLPKRKSLRKEFREQLEATVSLGTWRKPESMRKTHRS